MLVAPIFMKADFSGLLSYLFEFSAKKLRMQEDLFRTRAMRREGEMRREYLLNKAKVLQGRAARHKTKVKNIVLKIDQSLYQHCTKNGFYSRSSGSGSGSGTSGCKKRLKMVSFLLLNLIFLHYNGQVKHLVSILEFKGLSS